MSLTYSLVYFNIRCAVALGMPLVIGNSLVRAWAADSQNKLRVVCLPGATLERLMTIAKDERDGEETVIIQSGIPDLHHKGSVYVDAEKLQHYRGLIETVHRTLQGHCILLPIYPPLGASQAACSIYAELNNRICNLNQKGTPNTTSRIFHRDHQNKWRVEAARLEDGIHPSRVEAHRMLRRVCEFLGLDKETEEEPPTKTRRIERTVHNDRTGVTARIELELQRKEEELAKLKRFADRKEKEIEDECVRKIKEIMEREGGEEQSQADKKKKDEPQEGAYIVVDEWRPSTQDVRNDVPKVVRYI